MGWMHYLIDTNICIYILNKRPAEVIARFKQYETGMIGVSTITVSELYYGVAKSQKQEQNLYRLKNFLAPLAFLPYDELAAAVYGRIRCALEQEGAAIGALDLLIAAQALSRNLVLVTNNEKEFSRVEKLRIENWTE